MRTFQSIDTHSIRPRSSIRSFLPPRHQPLRGFDQGGGGSRPRPLMSLRSNAVVPRPASPETLAYQLTAQTPRSAPARRGKRSASRAWQRAPRTAGHVEAIAETVPAELDLPYPASLYKSRDRLCMRREPDEPVANLNRLHLSVIPGLGPQIADTCTSDPRVERNVMSR